MGLKEFNETHKIPNKQQKEQERFVNRINQSLLDRFEKAEFGYETRFKSVCFQLGENANDLIDNASGPTWRTIPSLRILTKNNFLETLRVLHIVYETSTNSSERQMIEVLINSALSEAVMDVGVFWKNGTFYPSGAKILDQQLVSDVLDWLKEYPDERKDYESALLAYKEKRFSDVIGYCYTASEGIIRMILNNKKTFENNIDDFLKKVSLSQNWKSIIRNYFNYANEYKRHSSEDRHDINPNEVEGFLYLTGLLIRLCMSVNK